MGKTSTKLGPVDPELRHYPLGEAYQVSLTLGQADLQSDVPHRGIWWPRMVLTWVQLT